MTATYTNDPTNRPIDRVRLEIDDRDTIPETDALLTDEEIQEQLNLPGNTQRPRRGELATQGRIRKLGSRPTKSRRMAAVWVANEVPTMPTAKVPVPKAVTIRQMRGGIKVRKFKSFVVTKGRVQSITFPQTLSILAGDKVTIE